MESMSPIHVPDDSDDDGSEYKVSSHDREEDVDELDGDVDMDDEVRLWLGRRRLTDVWPRSSSRSRTSLSRRRKRKSRARASARSAGLRRSSTSTTTCSRR